MTILVVEDSAEGRALARAILEDEGYRVITARNGIEGVEKFAREHPACVLLDVQMPGLDGPEACEQIRALPGGAETSIVFLTASRDVETFDRALLAGGDDFLAKPFRPDELTGRVAAALKVRALGAERNELYTQVKHQRDDLQRLQFHKEQLTSFLVHDLKNPVQAIQLHAEIVMRDHDGSAKSKRSGEKIHDESLGLLRMITALLDIAKADEGMLVPALEVLVLAPLVAEVVSTLGARAATEDVRMSSSVSVRSVVADRGLLKRVLENLVENGLRHSPEGTALEISAHAVVDGVELRVRDCGSGVPADQRVRVFERFVQGNTSASYSNRGLGLAFCKLAVEAHGGRIWVEDARPGAAFHVWIPS